MTTVNVYTAERMAAIEAQAVIGAELVDGHIIFERFNGTTFDGGAIDVSVIGNLTLNVDEETFYRYTDAASPLALTGGIETPLDDTIMDTSDGDPSWGHWDTDDNNRFVFDETGFYDIFTYAVVDSSADGTGHSTIKITDTATSGAKEFDHVSGTDVRPEIQMTNMYMAGEFVRVDVKTSGSYNLTYGEVFIRKLNIVMDGGVETAPNEIATYIYSTTESATLGSAGDMDTSLSFELFTRSTVNVQINWRYIGTVGVTGELTWQIDGDLVQTPSPVVNNDAGDHTEHITTGTTLDAGAHTIRADFIGSNEGDGGGSSGGYCRIDIVAIVGVNTEDDSVVYV